MPPFNVIFLIIFLFLGAFIYSNIGLGGGTVYVPIMLTFTPFQIQEVIPLSLAFACGTAISAGINHYARGLIDVKTGTLMAVGAVCGAVVGVQFTLWVNVFVLSVMFSAIVILLCIRMFYEVLKGHDETKITIKTRKIKWKDACTLGGGFGGGFVSGSLGIGGGSLFVPYMLYVLRMETRCAMGTSFFIIVISTFTGFLTFYMRGTTGIAGNNVWLSIILVVLVVVGSYIGSHWGLKTLKTPTVKVIFICALLLGVIKVIQRAM